MNKTKFVISGERQKVMQKAAKRPCSVCDRGDGNNSIQYTNCQKWVHKKCSGIKGSMSKVMKSFICRGCLNPVTSTSRTSWCQCKSEVGGYILLFRRHAECRRRTGDADAAVENSNWIK